MSTTRFICLFATFLILSGLTYQQKIPEIEKSLTLVKHLKAKQEEGETVVTRYNLADTVYTKAELDVDSGIVNLWLGANVMIEYTYEEAIELLSSKEEKAKKDLEDVRILDLLFLIFSAIVRADKYLSVWRFRPILDAGCSTLLIIFLISNFVIPFPRRLFMIWPLPGTRSSPQRSILAVFTIGMCATSELRRSRRRVPGMYCAWVGFNQDTT